MIRAFAVALCMLLSITDAVAQTPALTRVDTYVAQKALRGGQTPSLFRTGYLTAGDAGAALFRWSASASCADDIYNCVAPNTGSGRWLRVDISLGVSARSYGAIGNGAAPADAALTAACAAATAAGVPLLINGAFLVSGDLALVCDIAFDSAGKLSPNTGKTITITGNVTASPTQTVFGGAGTVTAVTAKWVSVAWWGALTAADAMPAFRAAVGSSRTIYAPPATYTCKSYDTNPFPLIAGPICLTLNTLDHFTLAWSGAKFTRDNSHVDSNYVLIANSTDFTVDNPDMVANFASLLAGNEPTGFLLVTDSRFRLKATYSGNWGGASRHPAAVAANFISDGTIDLAIPQASECIDGAYFRRIAITIRGIGANDSGSLGGTVLSCVNIQADHTFVTNYPAQATFTVTSDVTITAESVINSFVPFGVYLSHGSGYTIKGHYAGNGRGAVGLFYDHDSVCCNSIGAPVQDVNIEIVTNTNGVTSNSYGDVWIDASAVANADLIGRVVVGNSVFDTPAGFAIGAASTVGLGTLAIGKNHYTGNLVNDVAVRQAGSYLLQLGPYTITNTSTQTLPTGDGVLRLRQTNVGACAASNDVAEFIAGGAGVALAGSSAGTWVQSATPAAGHIGAYSSGSYTIKNALGCTAVVSGTFELTGAVN